MECIKVSDPMKAYWDMVKRENAVLQEAICSCCVLGSGVLTPDYKHSVCKTCLISKGLYEQFAGGRK
jgi:hypothetical protein